MEAYLTGEALCQGIQVHYYLLERYAETERQYGIRVECGSDRTELLNITNVPGQIRSLLEMMCRGAVTPVTAGDIVEDWLLR